MASIWTGTTCLSLLLQMRTEGLPVGIQIVGRHRDDLGVLELARAFERATGFWKQRPPVADRRG